MGSAGSSEVVPGEKDEHPLDASYAIKIVKWRRHSRELFVTMVGSRLKRCWMVPPFLSASPYPFRWAGLTFLSLCLSACMSLPPTHTRNQPFALLIWLGLVVAHETLAPVSRIGESVSLVRQALAPRAASYATPTEVMTAYVRDQVVPAVAADRSPAGPLRGYNLVIGGIRLRTERSVTEHCTLARFDFFHGGQCHPTDVPLTVSSNVTQYDLQKPLNQWSEYILNSGSGNVNSAAVLQAHVDYLVAEGWVDNLKSSSLAVAVATFDHELNVFVWHEVTFSFSRGGLILAHVASRGGEAVDFSTASISRLAEVNVEKLSTGSRKVDMAPVVAIAMIGVGVAMTLLVSLCHINRSCCQASSFCWTCADFLAIIGVGGYVGLATTAAATLSMLKLAPGGRYALNGTTVDVGVFASGYGRNPPGSPDDLTLLSDTYKTIDQATGARQLAEGFYVLGAIFCALRFVRTTGCHPSMARFGNMLQRSFSHMLAALPTIAVMLVSLATAASGIFGLYGATDGAAGGGGVDSTSRGVHLSLDMMNQAGGPGGAGFMDAHDILGPLLFGAFFVVLAVFILNGLVAVMVQAYHDAKVHEINPGENFFVAALEAWNCYAFCGLCKCKSAGPNHVGAEDAVIDTFDEHDDVEEWSLQNLIQVAELDDEDADYVRWLLDQAVDHEGGGGGNVDDTDSQDGDNDGHGGGKGASTHGSNSEALTIGSLKQILEDLAFDGNTTGFSGVKEVGGGGRRGDRDEKEEDGGQGAVMLKMHEHTTKTVQSSTDRVMLSMQQVAADTQETRRQILALTKYVYARVRPTWSGVLVVWWRWSGYVWSGAYVAKLHSFDAK